MKRIIIPSILFLFSLYSCQEVIEIDLNSSNPVVVVDGSISIGEAAKVHLSYTRDYFTNDTPQNIVNAKVTLIAGNEDTEELEYTDKGIYLGKKLLGKQNTKYELKVELPDQELYGQSEIPSKIELISMHLQEASFSHPGMKGNTDSIRYNINLTFTDNKDQQNYYMLAITQNGKEGEYSYLMIDDEFYPKTGSITYAPMMYQFLENDTVNVKLYSLDQNTYAFYNQLADVTGGGGMRGMSGMGTPYNPSSNMGENVLGYFAAWAVVDTSIIVAPKN
ncbi:MAG: DUF4249 domain-containing protein [Prolixibacteraceae bacterium]